MQTKEHILIVDDDESTRKLLTHFLGRNGYETETAPGGKTALELAKQQPFHITLLDINLPDGQGTTLIGPLQQLQPDMAIVMLTANPTADNAIKALNEGAAAYLTKPWRPEEMLVSLRQVLERQRLIIQNRQLLESVQHELAERKRAEKALKASETRYRQLLELAPDALLFTDLSATIVAANQHAARLFGFHNATALAGKNVLTLLVPEEGRVSLSPLQRRLFARPVDHAVEQTLVRQDGSRFPAEIRTGIVASAQGEPTGFISAIRDISNRREAEARVQRLLRESQAHAGLVQAIIDSMPQGVVLLDSQHRVQVANPEAQAYLAQLAGVGPGDKLTELGDRPLSTILASIGPERSWQEVTLGREPSKEAERIFQVAAQPLLTTGPHQGSLVLVLRDVTIEHERLQRLHAQDRLATVGQLAAGIAHDFNNILGAISLYSELFMQSSSLPAEDQEGMAVIHRQAQRAAELVQQILDFSRQTVMERHPVELSGFLEQVMRLLQRTLPETINIELICGDEADYILDADLSHLQQALTNLAINARDAMPGGGRLSICLSAFNLANGQPRPVPEMQPGTWAKLTITDTGSGIRAADLPRIFEPFFTTKEPGQGTGLGLAQVHGIVRQHDGFTDVSSHPGQGTTFTIYLPLLSLRKRVAQPAPEAAFDPAGNLGILVVEDDPATRRAVRDTLERQGYQVLVAENGREALDLFERHIGQISLVLSDLVMPDMGGEALYAALTSRYPGIPMIAMTGYPLEAGGRALLDQGIVAWLQKPFSADNLKQVIDSALASQTRRAVPVA